MQLSIFGLNQDIVLYFDKMFIQIKPLLSLSVSISKICAIVNDKPENINKNVFNRGIRYHIKGTIPLGMYDPPVKLFEFKLKWKYAQKNEKNSINSESINNNIAYWNPLWTSRVWAPDCSSEKTSRSHVNITPKKRPNISMWVKIQKESEYQTPNQIEFKMSWITVNKPKLNVSGKMLGLTKWNGCPKLFVLLLRGNAENDENANDENFNLIYLFFSKILKLISIQFLKLVFIHFRLLCFTTGWGNDLFLQNFNLKSFNAI